MDVSFDKVSPEVALFRIVLDVDTIDETDKFFADAKRLADDVSQNQTFYTVKPLLNFWGAFTPSEEVDFLKIHLE
jgi:hypothetical protein